MHRTHPPWLAIRRDGTHLFGSAPSPFIPSFLGCLLFLETWRWGCPSSRCQACACCCWSCHSSCSLVSLAWKKFIHLENMALPRRCSGLLFLSRCYAVHPYPISFCEEEEKRKSDDVMPSFFSCFTCRISRGDLQGAEQDLYFSQLRDGPMRGALPNGGLR